MESPADWRPVEGGRGGDIREGQDTASEFANRIIVSNADRYIELQAGDSEDDTPQKAELSNLLLRQRLSDIEDTYAVSKAETSHLNEVDQTLSHLPSSTKASTARSKPAAKVIQWDDEIESTWRAKQKADAARNLKARFKGKAQSPTAEQLRQPVTTGVQSVSSDVKEEEAFLDELLG